MALHGIKLQRLSKCFRPVNTDFTSTEVAELFCKCFSTAQSNYQKDGYKLVVVGGGCGGLATASMFKKKLGAGNVAVIEPKTVSLVCHLIVIKVL